MNNTLISFIVTLLLSGCDNTTKTYANDYNTPLSHWGTEKEGIGHLRTANEILISSDDVITFNETRISNKQLLKYLHQMNQLNPQVQTILEFSPKTSCEIVYKIRQMMDSTKICAKENAMCSEWQP